MELEEYSPPQQPEPDSTPSQQHQPMEYEDRKPLLTPKTHSAYSLHSLTRKAHFDPRAEEDTKEIGLKKCLTAVDLIAYGVGSTVGAGIFVTVGVVAKQEAGPAILFSFLSAAVACLISAFCYAEFAASIPVSGSAYTFSYVALGELIGWLYVFTHISLSIYTPKLDLLNV